MKLWFLCILLLQVSIINGRQLFQKPKTGPQVAADFAKTTQSCVKDGDLGSLITAVGALAVFIPGPVGIAAMAGIAVIGIFTTILMDDKNKLSPEMDALRRQSIKLDEIAADIKGVEKEFSEHLRRNPLVELRNKIVRLQKFGASKEKSTTTFRKIFKQMCKNYDYAIFPEFFRNELVNYDLSSGLAKDYIKDLDQMKYTKFAGAMMLHFAEAVTLQYNCTAAVYEDEADLEETLQIFREENQKYMLEMKREMQRVKDILEKNVFTHAVQLVESYAHNHRSENSIDFSNGLYSTLLKKFYWRSWVLMVRDAPHESIKDSREYVTHANKPWYRRWLNLAGKSIILLAPESNANGSQVCPYIQGCADDVFDDGCDYIVKQLEHCVDSKTITGVGCIFGSDDFKVVVNTNIRKPNYIYEEYCTNFNGNFRHRNPKFYVYWIN